MFAVPPTPRILVSDRGGYDSPVTSPSSAGPAPTGSDDPLSSTQTLRPSPATSWANESPIGPAPTTQTSQSSVPPSGTARASASMIKSGNRRQPGDGDERRSGNPTHPLHLYRRSRWAANPLAVA